MELNTIFINDYLHPNQLKNILKIFDENQLGDFVVLD